LNKNIKQNSSLINFIKPTIGIAVLVILVGLFIYSNFSKTALPDSVQQPGPKNKPNTELRLQEQALQLKAYIKQHKSYNDSIAFLIDMKIPSGNHRFFVYNLYNNTIISKSLVAHGVGSNTLKRDSLQFSNINNSLCTSLGKYRIGKSYYGQFGKAYKLIGLDTSNNNAYLRNIVLHYYDQVPLKEQKQAIVNSYGCPMVHEVYFNQLAAMIDDSKQPILLHIYYWHNTEKWLVKSAESFSSKVF
jgi:hypothetical protein